MGPCTEVYTYYDLTMYVHTLCTLNMLVQYVCTYVTDWSLKVGYLPFLILQLSEDTTYPVGKL